MDAKDILHEWEKRTNKNLSDNMRDDIEAMLDGEFDAFIENVVANKKFEGFLEATYKDLNNRQKKIMLT